MIKKVNKLVFEKNGPHKFFENRIRILKICYQIVHSSDLQKIFFDLRRISKYVYRFVVTV